MWLIIAIVISLPALNGFVIAPYPPGDDVNLPTNSSFERREFSDYGNSFIPRLHIQLNNDSSRNLKFWSMRNELGSPQYHVGSLSPAYFPSWILSFLVKDAWIFQTIFVLGFIYLIGFFAIEIGRKSQAHPIAGLICAIVSATSPAVLFWTSFPLFIGIWCWSLGIYYSLIRLTQVQNISNSLILGFCVYSHLMIATPQASVYAAYIFAALLTWLSYRSSRGRMIWVTAFAGVCIGVLASITPFIDVYHMHQNSSRISAGYSFFAQSQTAFANLNDLAKFFLVTFTPDLVGSPIRNDYPLPFAAVSLPWPALLLVLAGLRLSRSQLPLIAILSALALMAFSPRVYEFSIKYLGFGFSRGNPLSYAFVPLFILGLNGADLLLRDRLKRSKLLLIGAVLLILLGSAVWCTAALGLRLSWVAFIPYAMLLVVLFTTNHHVRSTAVVLVALSFVVLLNLKLIVWQPYSDMRQRSRSTNYLVNELSQWGRFAITSNDVSFLPPNSNAALNLSSAHTYNSLSSKFYHRAIGRLGGKMSTLGRSNLYISPSCDDIIFQLSNIEILVSSEARSESSCSLPTLAIDGLHFSKVKNPFGFGQVFPADKIDQHLHKNQLPIGSKLNANSKESDSFEFILRVPTDSIAVFSHIFHENWSGTSIDEEGNERLLRTFPFAGVYQAYYLPKGSSSLKTEFKALGRFMIWVNIFWLVIALGLTFNFLGNFTRKSRPQLKS
ncbi:MAG: hypothetical protein KF767_07180 [Bdellovibrionaceae bacterium]|nr:hypothetical protein [Pseudobdellovibrionaceae bacterium]